MYPGLIDRFKAALFDGVMIIVMMYLMSLVFGTVENDYVQLRIIAFFSIFLLYDPLMTAFLGGTTGHFLVGIRVRKIADQEKKISLHLAFIRFWLKALLGWLSLLTVSTDRQHRAIHDRAVDSIVVYA